MSTRGQSLAAVLIGVAMAAVAQVLMKRGLQRIGAIQLGAGLGGKLGQIVTSPRVIGGLALYGLSSVFYLFALSREDLSFVYPLLALNFALIALLSRFVLGEQLGAVRIAGIIVVGVGFLLIAVRG